MSRKLPISQSFLILLAAVSGVLVGVFLPAQAAVLGSLGQLLIQLVKAVATPLVFLAILHAVLTTQLERRHGLKLLGVALLNGSLALALGLALSNLFSPGRALAGTLPQAGGAAFADKRFDPQAALKGLVPESLLRPFLENNVLAVAVLALLLGLALRRVEVSPGLESLKGTLDALLKATEVALGWVTALIPLAVFGVVASTVEKYGLSPLRGLVGYVSVVLVGLLVHVAVVYGAWVRVYARVPLRAFWAEARRPVVYALGVNSSLATLPLTLRALDALGVSRRASTLGACVGTNLNNDGILLYEGMAVLFVAQAAGIDLSLSQQLWVALIALAAAMGVAGVPEAGFVSLAVVLNTAGLPVEALPLLLSVDWVVARARSATNVLSDMTLSMALDGRRAEVSGVAPPGDSR